MNWKREASDKLKNYEAHRQSLSSIPQEIKRLESVCAGIRSAATDGMPVSRGGSTREDVLLSNIVHPLHRVAGFQALRRAGLLCQRREHLLQPVPRRLLDLQQVRLQSRRQQQAAVKPRPVLLKVLLPHPAVLAQAPLRRFAQLQVGDQVIPVLRVSQAVRHVFQSFPSFSRAHTV